MSRIKIDGVETEIQSIDLIDEVMKSNKAEQFVIRKIKDGINYSNGYSAVVSIRRKELTSTEQQYLDMGYKSLKSRNLVIRVAQGMYMLNPNALIVPNYTKAIEIWNEAVAKKKRIAED